MKPIHESIPQRIRRVCQKPKTVFEQVPNPWLMAFGILLLVLGVVFVGGLVAALWVGLLDAYFNPVRSDVLP